MSVSSLLLPWYEEHGRKNLPWQQQVTPYRSWVSEIMLQQTQVVTVVPYYEKFLLAFPDLISLANANIDDVLRCWAGLGYYARARNLHKTANIIQEKYSGIFPSSLEQLLELPGIGRSTAGGILSLAFGQSTPILDGNVKRVLARLFQIEGWSGKTAILNEFWSFSERFTPEQETGKYNQAMMDLGAMVCTRSKPDCHHCPLSSICQSFGDGTQLSYPFSKPKKKRLVKSCWMILHKYQGRVLLYKRDPQGIWGGLWSLPEVMQLTELNDWQMSNVGRFFEPKKKNENVIKHQFSHFDLNISIAEMEVSKLFFEDSTESVNESKRLDWVTLDELSNYGLPAPVKLLLDS